MAAVEAEPVPLATGRFRLYGDLTVTSYLGNSVQPELPYAPGPTEDPVLAARWNTAFYNTIPGYVASLGPVTAAGAPTPEYWDPNISYPDVTRLIVTCLKKDADEYYNRALRMVYEYYGRFPEHTKVVAPQFLWHDYSIANHDNVAPYFYHCEMARAHDHRYSGRYIRSGAGGVDLMIPHSDIYKNTVDAEIDGLVLYGGQYEDGYNARAYNAGPINPPLGTLGSHKYDFMSFAVLDAFLDKLTDKDTGPFPNLEMVVLTAHSIGGGFVARYALVNRYHEIARRRNIHVRYVPLNVGGKFFYPTERRWELLRGGTLTQVNGSIAQCDPDWDRYLIQYMTTNLFYLDESTSRQSSDYNYWPLGYTENGVVASDEWGFLRDFYRTLERGVDIIKPFVNDLSLEEIVENLTDRELIYCNGELDTAGDNKLEQTMMYYHALKRVFGRRVGPDRHKIVVVPSTRHDGYRMMMSTEVKNEIFRPVPSAPGRITAIGWPRARRPPRPVERIEPLVIGGMNRRSEMDDLRKGVERAQSENGRRAKERMIEASGSQATNLVVLEPRAFAIREPKKHAEMIDKNTVLLRPSFVETKPEEHG